jgi:L-lysine 2,3-aminomutase
VPKAEAIQLHLAIQQKLPGFLVPKLVQEIPHEPGKTWIVS